VHLLLLTEEFGGNSGAFGGWDGDAGPVGIRGGPGVVEEASAALWGGHEPDVSIADGDHGADGEVEVIGDEGGLIDEQQGDSGEAADGGFAAGEADHSGEVGELERDGIIAVAAHGVAEFTDKVAGFSYKFAALAVAGRNDEDEAPGMRLQAMQGFDGADGGFSPLAAAVEDDELLQAAEHGGLDGIGLKSEPGAGEVDGIDVGEAGGQDVDGWFGGRWILFHGTRTSSGLGLNRM